MAEQYVNADAEAKLQRLTDLIERNGVYKNGGPTLSMEDLEELRDLTRDVKSALMAVNTAKGFKIKYEEFLKVSDSYPDTFTPRAAFTQTHEVITEILGEDP